MTTNQLTLRPFLPAALWLPVLIKNTDLGADNDLPEFAFVGAKIPVDLDQKLPGVRISGFASPRTILSAEQRVEIEVFGSTFAGTALLASALADSLLGYHRVVMDDGRVVIIDSAEVDDPYEQDWGDPKITRFQFIASFSLRR